MTEGLVIGGAQNIPVSVEVEWSVCSSRVPRAHLDQSVVGAPPHSLTCKGLSCDANSQTSVNASAAHRVAHIAVCAFLALKRMRGSSCLWAGVPT